MTIFRANFLKPLTIERHEVSESLLRGIECLLKEARVGASDLVTCRQFFLEFIEQGQQLEQGQ